MSESSAISSSMSETRSFPPPADFVAAANIKSLDEYRELYDKSIRHPEEFWGQIAEQHHNDNPADNRWQMTLQDRLRCLPANPAGVRACSLESRPAKPAEFETRAIELPALGTFGELFFFVSRHHSEP